jgi:hypothetical protein
MQHKKIVIFGTGILLADTVGLLDLNVACYVSDAVPTADDIILQNAIRHTSDCLLDESRDDLFVVYGDGDENYARRKLTAMGFEEGLHFCSVSDLLFEYAYNYLPQCPTHIWGIGGTLDYYSDDLKPCMGSVTAYIVSDSGGSNARHNGLPVLSFKDYNRSSTDCILVCSMYYNEINTSLQAGGFNIGTDYMNVRTYVKLIKIAAFLKAQFDFENRSLESDNLLIVLAGYKPLLWDSVFPRLKKYTPTGFDVVVVTSGKISKRLKSVCSEYEWSYISTEKNNVSLALNVAVSLFPGARKIWKIDEDIFVTEGTFEAMAQTYNDIDSNSQYEVGFVTPLININAYGYARLMELTGGMDVYTKTYGEMRISDGLSHHTTIRNSAEAAKFMWGENNPAFSDIDALSEKLRTNDFAYSICPIRYSIGFILFSRQNWICMDMFPDTKAMNLGADEEHICKYCMLSGQVIGIAENTVVGHLAFGPQNKEMEIYYINNKSKFMVKA